MAHRSPRGKRPAIAEIMLIYKEYIIHFTLILFVFYTLNLNYEIDSVIKYCIGVHYERILIVKRPCL
jgi:hypothetical protein